MAQINICDLCKSPLQADNCAISIVRDDDITYGEICLKCYTDLSTKLTGLGPVAVGTPVEAVAVGTPVEDVTSTHKPKAPQEPTDKLLDHELVKVPSLFDRAAAEKAVRAMRGSCPHHFKSYDDGRVKCVGPPPGYDGELHGAGCGKILQPGEY